MATLMSKQIIGKELDDFKKIVKNAKILKIAISKNFIAFRAPNPKI